MKRYGTKKWLMDVDNKVRCSTVYNGLNYMQFKEDGPEWADWRRWPGLGIARDMAGDGNSGIAALQYYFKCNVWDWPDQSHAVKCVFEIVCKAMGWYNFVLLLLITWNLPFGPDDEHLRIAQIKEKMKHCYETMRPEEVPEFLEMAPKMIEELEDNGIYKFP